MDGMIYLDNAATSFPKPDVVHDKMIHFYRTCGVNPGRSGCDMALQAERLGSDCRVDPDAIRRAIQRNTKLVIVNHASNVCGVVQDIPAIGAVPRARYVHEL